MIQPQSKMPTTDTVVALRPSQIKFESEDFSFNVIRASTYGQGYLNRQIILLLHCLGVPEEWFFDKQEQAKLIFDAQEIVNTCKAGKVATGLSQAKGISQTLRKAATLQWDITKEPLLYNALYGMQLNAQLGIKKKARIIVPDSCTLIGTPDPCGVLAANEVFIQIRSDSFRYKLTAEGRKKKNKQPNSYDKARIQ